MKLVEAKLAETRLTSEKENRVTTNSAEFSPELFQKRIKANNDLAIVRPSLSYWQDAFRRFRSNKQSVFAFSLALILIFFSFIGPFIWIEVAFQAFHS